MCVYIKRRSQRRLNKKSFLVIFFQRKNSMFLPGVRSTKGGDMGSHGRCDWPVGTVADDWATSIKMETMEPIKYESSTNFCSKTYQHFF